MPSLPARQKPQECVVEGEEEHANGADPEHAPEREMGDSRESSVEERGQYQKQRAAGKDHPDDGFEDDEEGEGRNPDRLPDDPKDSHESPADAIPSLRCGRLMGRVGVHGGLGAG